MQKSLAFSFESTWEIEIEEMSKLNEDEEGFIYSSVLHLRGETPTKQPLVNDTGIMCYNGELWIEDSLINDTVFIKDKLDIIAKTFNEDLDIFTY